MVRAFAHGVMGRQGGPIELFLVPASAPCLKIFIIIIIVIVIVIIIIIIVIIIIIIIINL